MSDIEIPLFGETYSKELLISFDFIDTNKFWREENYRANDGCTQVESLHLNRLVFKQMSLRSIY